MALGKCSNDFCQEPIAVDDVDKATIIEKSPQFLALRYKCQACGHRSNLVASLTDWKEARKAAEPKEPRTVDIRPHMVELGAIEGADDLVSFWKAQRSPPILEDRIEYMRNCCDECRRRLYGQGV
jgi:hypothetical protein